MLCAVCGFTPRLPRTGCSSPSASTCRHFSMGMLIWFACGGSALGACPGLVCSDGFHILPCRGRRASEMANIFFWLCKSSVSVFVHWPVPPCSCPLPVGGSGLQGLSRAAPAASQAHLEQVLCKYPFAHLILRFSIERCLFHLEQPIVVASLTIFWISFLNAISFEWWHQCLER